MVGHAGVGHDGGGIRIGQHDFVSESAQRLARLGPGIVEFARLADDDRTGADDQNFLDVFPLCHDSMILFLCLPCFTLPAGA